MDNEPGGLRFAFGTMETVLETVEEESNASSISETEVQEKRAKLDSVTASAKQEILEMCELLKKLETGTATRVERERARSLKNRLSMRRREVEETNHEARTAERKMLEESTRKKEVELDLAIKKKGIRSVIRSVCAAECVDLAFVVDGTGSMCSHIASVKENIKKIVRNVTKTNGSLRIRLAFVCYRDISDGRDQFEVLDFTSSVSDFEHFVGKLEAKGGADAPEDMAGGIKKANGLSWEHPTRAVFLVADAPCHGREFHSFSDDYPNGSPGVNIISELKKLLGNHGNNGSMSMYFGKINTSTNSMLNVFQKKGVTFPIVDMQDASALEALVSSSIRKSIFKTVTLTGGATRAIPFTRGSLEIAAEKKRSPVSLKDYRILARKPSLREWKEQSAVAVKVYRNKPVTSISDLRSPLEVGMLKKTRGRTDLFGVSTMYMRRAPEPFAEGQIRLAYHGQLNRKHDDLHLEKSEMILKAYKHTGGYVNDLDQYLKQMEISNIVYFLATEYNKSSRPRHCATIQCLQNCVIEETSDINESSGDRRFCAEPPLPIATGAEFTKYSNNTGYWNDDEIDETLLRFTLYTYEITGEYLMVTDLQGIRKDGVYYLTDPVILCNDLLRFGNTNLGRPFMKKCLESTRAYLADNGWKE